MHVMHVLESVLDVSTILQDLIAKDAEISITEVHSTSAAEVSSFMLSFNCKFQLSRKMHCMHDTSMSVNLSAVNNNFLSFTTNSVFL